jgi:hypothetical protein
VDRYLFLSEVPVHDHRAPGQAASAVTAAPVAEVGGRHTPVKRGRSGLVAHRPRERGAWQLCHYPALPSADDSGDDDLVTAAACSRSSQSSQHVAGVTAGGEALRLSWRINRSAVDWWCWGTTNQPPSPDQPRKCGGSDGCACCGGESEADGTPTLERGAHQLCPHPACPKADRRSDNRFVTVRTQATWVHSTREPIRAVIMATESASPKEAARPPTPLARLPPPHGTPACASTRRGSAT